MACRKIIDWDSVTHLFGKLSDTDIAKRLEIDRTTVGKKRLSLGIAKLGKSTVNWSEINEEFGKTSDRELAKKLGVNKSSVMRRRHVASVLPISQNYIDWTQINGLGCVADSEIAKQLNVNNATVANHRRKLGIPAFNPPLNIDWDIQPFGRFTDQHIADLLGCSPTRVVNERNKRGIKPSALLYRTEEKEAAYYGEAVIDAWLHKHNIPHVFQKKIVGKKVDWFLPTTQEVWEYAGFSRHGIHGNKYVKQLHARVAIVQAAGFPVRIIEEKELKSFAETIDLRSLYRRSSFECSNCKKTDVRHQAHDLCAVCYRVYRKNNG